LVVLQNKNFKKQKKIYGSDSDKLLEPYLWLYNQDQMRETWKSFKEEMEHVEIIGKYLLNNPFSEYQQFHFGPIFGKKWLIVVLLVNLGSLLRFLKTLWF